MAFAGGEGLSALPYFLLEYALVDDYIERRTPLRPEHLSLARDAFERGELVFAGALTEPTDRAVLVWSTQDRSPIEAFVGVDPYVRNGLVKTWTIRPWTVVVGEGVAPVA
jgi:uncharacterized protein